MGNKVDLTHINLSDFLEKELEKELETEVKSNLGEESFIDYRDLYLELCQVLSESFNPDASAFLKSRALDRYFKKNNIKI